MTDWFGGRGQVKWLTGLVAGGKANDWLTWWHGDTVTQWCGEMVMRWCSGAVMWWRGMQWCSGRGQVKWLTGLVAGGKANDLLVWWQGARQMTDWFGGRGQGKWLTNMVTWWHSDAVMWWNGYAVMQWCSDVVTWWCSDAVVEGKSNDWLVW